MSDAAVNPADILALAEKLALRAGDHTLEYFGGVVDAESKGDGTPVTKADREAEILIRDAVLERYPDHGILGEEFGEVNPGAHTRWILDPIDGTRSFSRGVPLYGVMIGVESGGEPIVGVVHFPALGETVAAGLGLGCKWNGTPCHVSDVEKVDDSLLLITDAERVLSHPETPGWRELQRRCAFSRTWGDCYGHILVATGRAEAMVDPILSPWDAAPLLTILTEAGGRFTSLDRQASIHAGSGVSSNGHVHEEVLAALSG